ncbi:ubiquitin carboxyl terminal hydrolase 37 [Trichuris trichiura]|uniref:Ubiquitin carboxyl-terminal hydrolase n=1 Tax=Trichuris trichiura TaxID=36087 RepID=A0A077ZIT4_TRITR|nr:ubiquitin carboxyl terminal hydrolase 37 [Trichuris trichiura]
MDAPVVSGTVRLDGAASFPLGWQPGSWSFTEMFEDTVVVIECVYKGCGSIDCLIPLPRAKALRTPSVFANSSTPRTGKVVRRPVSRNSLTKEGNVDITPEKENSEIFSSSSSSQHILKFYSNGMSEQRQYSSYQTRAAVRKLANESTPPAGGFSNLGNTCYMNSILQAVLGQKPFSQELWRAVVKNRNSIPNNSLLRDESIEVGEAWAGLFDQIQVLPISTMTPCLVYKNGDAAVDKPDLLQAIKDKVAATAGRFNDHSEHDAQEFLVLLLDQLADEVEHLNLSSSQPQILNPVLRNFAFSICHYLKCKEILILHVKRYKYNEESKESEKAKNAIRIPTFLTLQDYCVSDAFESADLTASTKKYTSFQNMSPAKSATDLRFSAKGNSSAIRRRLFEDNDSLKTSLSKRSAEETLPTVSKRSALAASAEFPTEEEIIIDDDFTDSEYQKQLSEAIRRSLLENSGKDLTTDSMDSVDVASFFSTSASVLSEIEENEIEGFLPRSFRLSAVVSHIGYSSTTGHYVSDVFDWKEREWYCYDDSTVSRTSESIVQKKREKNGYIFFYVDKKLLADLSLD